MTDAPASRQTHIVRIFGTNRAGDILSDIWADLERIDVAKSATQRADGVWQGAQRKFDWMDDPQADDYAEDGNPARAEEIIKVCSPDEADVNDPDEWIPVRAIKALRSNGTSTGDQKFVDRLINDELNEARVFEVRRIVHYDTNIDADANAAAVSGQKAYVVASEQYEKDNATKDAGQYVDHEIITALKGRTNEHEVGRKLQTVLLNQYLIDDSEATTSDDVVGENGINPPYRLDPYQNIVNVSLSRSVMVVFFGPAGSGAYPLSIKLTSEMAKLLGSRSVPLGAPFGDQVYTMYFLKVPTSIKGEFASVTLPGVFGDTSPVSPFPFPTAFYAITCNLSGSTDSEQMDSAAKAARDTALAGITITDDGRFQNTKAAPGVLFSVYLHDWAPGTTLPWKITNTNHREDNSVEPPNKMVQCYPLSVDHKSYSYNNLPTGTDVFTVKYLGYEILSYRLDRKGTGANYTNAAWTSDVAGQSLTNGVIEGSTLGIAFQDDLPLASADIVI